jgi:hypothetical protein
MTRARDRLYLAATLADGRLVAFKGGLGRTLPPSLALLFTAAPHTDGAMTWQGPTGAHVFRVLRPAAAPARVDDLSLELVDRIDDFTPLVTAAPARRVVTGDAGQSPPTSRAHAPMPGPSIDVGVLVHRALDAGTDDVETLVRPDERALVSDLPRLLASAARALTGIRSHPVFAEALDGDDVLWRRHEVPYTTRAADGAVVRGTIDCVVRRRTGALDVFEFKTGRRDDAHERQLDAYVRAAQQLFPGALVTGHVIYADDAQLSGD